MSHEAERVGVETVGGVVLTQRARRFATATVSLAFVIVASGCGVDPNARADAPSAIFGAGISDEIDALEILDPQIRDKIGDCVESAKFKAFNGDPEWQQVWVDSDESVAAFRQLCERLAKREPDRFSAIHTEWVAWELSTGARQSSPSD